VISKNLIRRLLRITSEILKLRKERETLVSKTEYQNYKTSAQQEIKDLKKEIKNLRKDLQISSQKLEDEQKKSFVKKHLTILPTQIKKLVSDLAIVEDDSLKAIWRKVTDKETDLISKIPNTEAEKKQQSDLLSKLLAFKYIVLRIYEGEDKT
jgi:molecular chaperone GrpE (heat shock protein)